jgi:hypothetical protein
MKTAMIAVGIDSNAGLRSTTARTSTLSPDERRTQTQGRRGMHLNKALIAVGVVLAIGCAAAQASASDSRAHSIGVFRPSTGQWFLDVNDNGAWDGCTTDVCGQFGMAGDQPFVTTVWVGTTRQSGDIVSSTGDHIASKIGVYRPSTGWMYWDYYRNFTWDARDQSGYWGGGQLVAATGGHWGTSGLCRTAGDCVATFLNGRWWLDQNPNMVFDPNSGDTTASFGTAGDQPVVVGDNLAVFRNGQWFIDSNRNNYYDGGDTYVASFGQAGDIPISATWAGTGGNQCLGVFRPSTGQWLLDWNCNRRWDGVAGGDVIRNFGQNGDKPVVGFWGLAL